MCKLVRVAVFNNTSWKQTTVLIVPQTIVCGPVLNYPQATHDWRELLGETSTWEIIELLCDLEQREIQYHIFIKFVPLFISCTFYVPLEKKKTVQPINGKIPLVVWCILVSEMLKCGVWWRVYLINDVVITPTNICIFPVGHTLCLALYMHCVIYPHNKSMK